MSEFVGYSLVFANLQSTWKVEKKGMTKWLVRPHFVLYDFDEFSIWYSKTNAYFEFPKILSRYRKRKWKLVKYLKFVLQNN